MTEGVVVIKRGREKPILNKHPWVFSGSVQFVDHAPQPADVVQVVAHDGAFLARGYYNPQSQIVVRLLSWDADEAIDEAFWRRRLQRAIGGRMIQQQEWGTGVQNAVRLVHGENDYLPGLVVDRYGDWLVMQALTLGIDARKTMLAETLADMLNPEGVYERSDVDVRQLEGLRHETGVLWGEEPPEVVEIDENSLQFPVNIREGQKTGFYLDQRESRGWLHDHIYLTGDETEEDERTVLNLFSYTGGFGLYALAAGVAHVTNVDSSMPALEIAEETVEANDLPTERAEFIQADVFELLRDYAAEGKQFDVVVLDPPKFAQSQKQVEAAARGYKDINLHAFQCVKPGGYLYTFSCSGAIDPDLFQKIVFGALADSRRDAQIIRHLRAGDDHPVALTFPEGEYLKGLVCRVW